MANEFFRLNLVSPVLCLPVERLEPFSALDAVPGGAAAPDAERVFCFELDEKEYRSFDPDEARFPGKLVFGGVSGAGAAITHDGAAAAAGTTNAVGAVKAGVAVDSAAAGTTNAAAGAGKALPQREIPGIKIPSGAYLFTQKREVLSREEIIRLAVELQMEALWQRLKPDRQLYLRYVYEDGSWVTQLFRQLCLSGD